MEHKRAFTYEIWDFDCNGEAFVIAKDQCPEQEKVAAYIADQEGFDPACANEMIVEEGYCKYQCRSDWENDDCPRGGYTVEQQKAYPTYQDGRRKRGWFPVWIIRLGDWYY